LGARVREFARVPELQRVVVLLVVLAIFTYLNPGFIRGASLAAIVQSMSLVGIVAVGLTLLIIAGEFDLSVGSTAALASGVAAVVATHQVEGATLAVVPGVPPLAAILVGLAVGVAVGAVNAIVVLVGRVPSFIATIAMLGIARGLTAYITEAKAMRVPEMEQLGWLNAGPVSLSVAVMLVLVVIGHFVVVRTNFGRSMCATGSNAEAARVAGVKTMRVKAVLFVITGLLAGLAGVITNIHFKSTTIATGTGWELFAIAAVVIGGTSLFGGGGTVIGTLIGLAILQSITSGLVVIYIDPWWQTVLVGTMILLSVAIDSVQRRRIPT
jgi:ribose/xylose/arabinose/galactoside ABC-type transport system permease subunit